MPATRTLHFRVQQISRNKARPDNAVAACAYRAGRDLHCEKESQSYHYGNRKGVVNAGIFVPADAPEWMRNHDFERFGNEIEAVEDGHNRWATAVLAKDFQAAAPRELSHQENWELGKAFAGKLNERGYAVLTAYHCDKASDGGQNPHFHFMLPTRKVDELGFSKKKSRDLDVAKGAVNQQMIQLRRDYYALVNQALAKKGIDSVYYDPEKQEGKKPKRHLGKDATAMEEKGVKTRVGNYNRRVDVENFMDAVHRQSAQGWDSEGEGEQKRYVSREKYRLQYELNRTQSMAVRDLTQKTQSNVVTPPVVTSDKATEQIREAAKLAARQSRSFVERERERARGAQERSK